MSEQSLWLPGLVVLLLAGAATVAVLPRADARLAKLAGLGVSLAALLVVVGMGLTYDTAGASPEQLPFDHTWSVTWIPSFGVDLALGVDGSALALLALTATLVPVVLLASWTDAEAGARPARAFVALVLLTEALLVGVFAATDVFLFYVCFEAMLIPMYFLIGSWGGPRRQYAAMKFLLYSLAGGLVMLAAVIGLYVVSLEAGEGTFAFRELADLEISRGVQVALFSGFFVAFAVKAPLFPFHTWLPDAGSQAPPGVAVLLVGVLDKVGTFGFLRYCIPLFPDAAELLRPVVFVLAVVGIFYGAFLAMGQRDLLRFVSYTSVAHFGFITLGIFAVTSQGVSGSVLYMVNHGLATGALFLVVGFMVARTGTADIGAYGGMTKVAPLLAGSLLVAGLSSLALPGTNSFVSEFLVLVGTFTVSRVTAVLATIGIILAALYVLLMYQRTMTGPLNPRLASGVGDLRGREVLAIAPVLALVLVLGVYPRPLLDVITPTAAATVAEAGQSDPAPVAGDFSPSDEAADRAGGSALAPPATVGTLRGGPTTLDAPGGP